MIAGTDSWMGRIAVVVCDVGCTGLPGVCGGSVPGRVAPRGFAGLGGGLAGGAAGSATAADAIFFLGGLKLVDVAKLHEKDDETEEGKPTLLALTVPSGRK